MDTLGVRGLLWYQPRPPTTPHCTEGTASRWCVALSRNRDSSWSFTISNAETSRTARVRLQAPHGPHSELIVDTQLARGADGSVTAGVIRIDGGRLARGEWQTHRLILVRITAERAAIVLDLPLLGSAALRGCHSERDRRRRLGVCEDDYGLSAGFLLDTSNASSRTPVFVVTTQATTYPGRRSRLRPVRVAPQPGLENLVYWHDAVCSYERRYRFDAASGRYRPDSPVPACADYLDFE